MSKYAHPAHPCAKAMHTRVQRGVQGGVHLDRLPSEDFPEDLKVLIFQRFSEHIVHIDGVVGSSPTVTTQKSGSPLRWS